MTSKVDSLGAIRIIAPTTDAQWCYTEVLERELKEWDLRESAALGFDADEIIEVFYPENLPDSRVHSVPPDGRMLVAMDGDQPVGCAAFRRLTPTSCEAYNVYVRPSHQGRGIASTLLQQLLGEARGMGYSTMCLETATFMLNAHKLYRSLSFQVRSPYRSLPDRMASVTLWMECTL